MVDIARDAALRLCIDEIISRLFRHNQVLETIRVLIVSLPPSADDPRVLGDELHNSKIFLREDAPPHLVVDPAKRHWREAIRKKLFLKIRGEPKPIAADRMFAVEPRRFF